MGIRSSGTSMGISNRSSPMGPVSIGTSILTLPRSIRRAATRSSIFTAKGSRFTPKMAIGRLCKFFLGLQY